MEGVESVADVFGDPIRQGDDVSLPYIDTLGYVLEVDPESGRVFVRYMEGLGQLREVWVSGALVERAVQR